MIQENNHIFPIKNRQNQTFFARWTPNETSNKYIVIQHGFTGSMNQPHIKTIEQTYQEMGYSTFSIDCTNSFNQSDGTLHEITITQHCTDLEDAIHWLRQEKSIDQEIALAGHSMGGFSVLQYAANHPHEIQHILASAIMTSGINLLQAWKQSRTADMERWRNQNYLEFTSTIDPTEKCTVPWKVWEEFTSHTLFNLADKLTMPVFFLNGDKDTTTPLPVLERFYRQVPEPKSLHIIKEADHSYTTPALRSSLATTIKKVIGN